MPRWGRTARQLWGRRAFANETHGELLLRNSSQWPIGILLDIKRFRLTSKEFGCPIELTIFAQLSALRVRSGCKL